MKKIHAKQVKFGTKPIRLAILMMLAAIPSHGWAEEANPPASQANAVVTSPEADLLPEVQVKGNADRETPTSHVRGYVAKRGMTATKTDTALIETPQSISVITSDQFEDQRAQSLQEILRYSAGVISDQYGLDSRSDGYSVRGMDATQYINGLRGFNAYYTETTRPDPYALERVEVLHGPASMLYGAGGVGGIVNVVTKRPEEIARREVGISLGNYNRKQIQADLTGPVGDSDNLFYRLVLLGRDTNTQVDHTESERTLIAPSLTWKDDKTSLTLLAQYQKDADDGSTPQFLPWSGVLRHNPNGKISFDTFLGDPDFDKYVTESNQFGWAFEHIFNDTWTVRQNLRYTSSKNLYRSLYVFSFTGGLDPFNPGSNERELNRSVDSTRSDSKTLNVDNNAEAKFETGAFKHTLLMGLDYSRFRQQQNGYFDNFQGNPIDVFNPVYNPVDFSNVVAYKNPLVHQLQTGAYVQDQIKLDNWIATMGLRRDRATGQQEDSDDVIDWKTTGRYGLTYVFDNGWAPYVSYAESFLPVQGADKAGNLFKPQEGKAWEAGVKYMPEGSRTKFTAAVFDMKDTNRLTPDPTSPFDSVQKGEVRTRGLELEAATSFDHRLDVIASYTYLNAEYSKSNVVSIYGNSEQGNQVETIPQDMASVWAVKRFAIGDTDGFRVGLGVRYIGDSWDSTHHIQTPDVTLFDGLLGFDSGSWRYALNASNLFDKEYVSTCLSRGDCWLGQRRQAIASATFNW